jgi:hypothetical protein
MPLDAEPVGQSDQAPDATKAENQANQTNPDVPIRPSALAPPPAKPHCEITCKTEKTRWDKFKDSAEIIGICLLAVYTGYTIKMYRANKKAANAADSAARTAAQSLQLDQRAWVGPNEITHPQFIVERVPVFVKVGRKTTLGVVIINSGKSPALAVESKTNIKAMPASETFFADYPPAETKAMDSLYVLQPGMRMELDSLPTGVPVSAEHVDGFKSGAWILYFYGEITYADIFRQVRHATHFCLALSRDLARLGACPTYNDAD